MVSRKASSKERKGPSYPEFSGFDLQGPFHQPPSCPREQGSRGAGDTRKAPQPPVPAWGARTSSQCGQQAWVLVNGSCCLFPLRKF